MRSILLLTLATALVAALNFPIPLVEVERDERRVAIHAERQLRCSDCHHALNNPARVSVAKGRSPAHLRYDPRSLEIDQYLPIL